MENLNYTTDLKDFNVGDNITIKHIFEDTNINTTNNYNLKYVFINENNKEVFNFTYNNTTKLYELNLTTTQTEQFTAGEYLVAFVLNNTTLNTQKSVQIKYIKLNDNINNIEFKKTISHAKKMLLAIEATLENRATSDHLAYTIAGRSISKMTVESLMKFRDYYKNEVSMEEIKKKNNGKNKNKIKIFWNDNRK